MQKFLRGRIFKACFIAYILLTALIFYMALADGTKSSAQSAKVSDVFSDAVSFVTGGKLDLKSDGKSKDFPKAIKLKGYDGRTLKTGETINFSYEFSPAGNYDFTEPEITVSDQSVILIENKKATAISEGVCTITIKEPKSCVTDEVTVTVSSEKYKPEFKILGCTPDKDENGNEAYYYDETDKTGTLYFLKIKNEGVNFELFVNGTKIESSDKNFLIKKNGVLFYTSGTGNFNYVLKTDDGREESFSVTVTDKNLTAPEKPLIKFNRNEITVEKGETVKSEFDSDKGNRVASQKLCPAVYDGDKIELKSGNITGKAVGNTDLTVYFAGKDGIETASLKIKVVNPSPTGAKMLSTNDYLIYGQDLHISIVKNNVTLPDDDFIWKVSDEAVAKISSGKLHGANLGKVTVTATAKSDPTAVYEKVYEVRYSYFFLIRKIIGHFSAFLLLAIFAIIVYYRLAETINETRAEIYGPLYSLSAGLITACLSEILQLGIFTGGRIASLTDVLIDFAGFAFGTAIALLVWFFMKKTRKTASFLSGF